MKERLSVGFMFKQINNIYEKEFNNLLRGIGITSSQCAVLDYLLGSSKEFMNQKDIEKEFGLRPSTATELLKTLESRKMIQRVSSEEDGRYKKIQFTEAAEDIRLALQQEIQKTEGLLVEGISQEDLNTFMKVAEKMLENLER